MEKFPLLAIIYLGLSILVLLCEEARTADEEQPEPSVHWTEQRSSGSRALGFKSKKKARNVTARPTWRPKENGKLMLAKQKGMNHIVNLSQIPDDDPEFNYIWPDDYYDNYDFEHHKNMIQHGTFESRILKYYKAEFDEAMANLNKTAKETNETDTEVVDAEVVETASDSGISLNETTGSNVSTPESEKTKPEVIPTKIEMTSEAPKMEKAETSTSSPKTNSQNWTLISILTPPPANEKPKTKETGTTRRLQPKRKHKISKSLLDI